MVEKIIVNPQNVRGLGNVCTEKDLDDFGRFNSSLSAAVDTINGVVEKVFLMAFNRDGLSFYWNGESKLLYLHSDNDVVVGFSFSEKSLVFNTVSHISFDFADKNLVVDDEHYLFVDYAVTGKHNTKWWATGTLNITTSSNGTLVKNENSSGYSLDYSYITDNFPSGWSDRENAVTCYPRPFVVEFDLVSVSSTSSVGLYIGNSSENVHTYFTNLGITGTGHVRIEVSTTQVKCYLDETLVSTNNLSNSVTTSRVGFRVNSGNNFKYKDFRIWER